MLSRAKRKLYHYAKQIRINLLLKKRKILHILHKDFLNYYVRSGRRKKK